MKMIKISSDESYLVMKVILSWKLSSDESYHVTCDEIYLVMKVIILVIKDILLWKLNIQRSDGLWRFACGDVLLLDTSTEMSMLYQL